jgi:hypothetical protein
MRGLDNGLKGIRYLKSSSVPSLMYRRASRLNVCVNENEVAGNGDAAREM